MLIKKKCTHVLGILHTCHVNGQSLIPPGAGYDVTTKATTVLRDGKSLPFDVVRGGDT